MCIVGYHQCQVMASLTYTYLLVALRRPLRACALRSPGARAQARAAHSLHVPRQRAAQRPAVALRRALHGNCLLHADGVHARRVRGALVVERAACGKRRFPQLFLYVCPEPVLVK